MSGFLQLLTHHRFGQYIVTFDFEGSHCVSGATDILRENVLFAVFVELGVDLSVDSLVQRRLVHVFFLAALLTAHFLVIRQFSL